MAQDNSCLVFLAYLRECSFPFEYTTNSVTRCEIKVKLLMIWNCHKYWIIIATTRERRLSANFILLAIYEILKPKRYFIATDMSL